MKQMVFSVFDSKGGVYGPPIFVINRAVAIRSFSDAVNQSGSEFSRHASDYKLYQLGEYDNVSGELIKLTVPDFVAHASDFIKEVTNG